MSQLRLNGKAILFIENQFANKLNFHLTTIQFSHAMLGKYNFKGFIEFVVTLEVI